MDKNHEGDNQFCSPNHFDTEQNDHVLPWDWRQEQIPVSSLKEFGKIDSNNYLKTVKVIRDTFKDCLVNEGVMEPWKQSKLNTHNIFIIYGIKEYNKSKKIV